MTDQNRMNYSDPLEPIADASFYHQFGLKLSLLSSELFGDRPSDNLGYGPEQLFHALACVAYERGSPTTAHVVQILSEGDEGLKTLLGQLARDADAADLQAQLGDLAKVNDRTLASYQSVLMSIGLERGWIAR